MNSNSLVMNEPITVMLVGGGNRYPAFIGALQAFEESGLSNSKIVASSSGAVVASLYASGLTPAEILDESLAIDLRSFRDVSLLSLLRDFGLCSGRKLQTWLETKIGNLTFSSPLKIPLEIVATDMRSYRPVIFNRERFPHLSIAAAASASTMIPGLFGLKRLEYEGLEYALIDGSLMTGVVEGRLSRSQKTLVVKVMSKRTLKRDGDCRLTLASYLQELMAFSLHSQEKEFLKGGKWKDTILVYCSEISPVRFSLSREDMKFLYAQGYEQTKKYLEFKWGVRGE